MEDQLVGLLLFLLALVVALVGWLIKREIGRFDKLPKRLDRAEREIREVKQFVGMTPRIVPMDDSMTEDSA